MPKRPSLWGSPKSTGTSNPYSTSSSGSRISTEIDLRAEFDCIIYGPNGDGVGRHGWPIIHRKMRRDADGYPTYCTCAAASQGRHGDPDCSYCDGEGRLFDEEWLMTFSHVGASGGAQWAQRSRRQEPGLIREESKIFYLRYDTVIQYEDKLVEVVLDTEGNVEVPYRRKARYKIHLIDDKRADMGRIEYYAITTSEDDAIRTDQPVAPSKSTIKS